MSHPAPEHEVLSCTQNNGAQSGASANTWFCHYNKRPEPTLNFYWNANQGFFSGQDVTATWTCPGQFPPVCQNVVQVVEGTMTFFQPSLHPPFSVLEDRCRAYQQRTTAVRVLGQPVCLSVVQDIR